MESIGRILLVEDDPKDTELTMTALEEYNLSNEVVASAARCARLTVAALTLAYAAIWS